MQSIHVAVVILTYNEELNLPFAIESVINWAASIQIVDSYSSDRTLEIARSYGVEIYQHTFDDFSTQRNWALDHLPFTSDWIFFLDADEQMTDELKHEIEAELSACNYGVSAYAIRQTFVLIGRVLKHSHDSPRLVRMVKRGRAHWICYGVRESCSVDGTIVNLRYKLWHEDHRGLNYWIDKHNNYTTREAALVVETIPRNVNINSERRLRVYIRSRIYPRVPRGIRPIAFFTYRYFIKFGFLDGYPGLVFCFLHAFWYPLLIDAKVYETRHKLTESRIARTSP